jgi:hypothetical protein
MDIVVKDILGNEIKRGSVVLIGTSGSNIRRAVVKSIEEKPTSIWTKEGYIPSTKFVLNLRTIGKQSWGRNKISRGNTTRQALTDKIVQDVIFMTNNINEAFPEFNVVVETVTKFKLKQ